VVVSLLGCASEDREPGPLPVGEWTELVAGDWTLEPGEEKYICAKKTLSHAVHVNGFRPIAPPGTHHSVLSITSAPGPDGVAPCSAAVDGHQILFATGLGTSELTLPDGIAATVPAGTQLLMNLHLVNATPQTLTGRSGASAFLVHAADVDEHAEVILAGKIDGLEVVPGASTQTGTCTFPGASTLFAVMPHMHARGRHLRVASGSDVLYDQDFDVDTQSYTLLAPPREMSAGEALTIDCSYENPSAETLHYGPYASDEMCYAILVRHPALDASPFCVD
jgi:hypothetical protein